jgi:hypothetical protein
MSPSKQRMMVPSMRGICQGCGAMYQIRLDGTIRRHLIKNRTGLTPCGGAGLKPERLKL